MHFYADHGDGRPKVNPQFRDSKFRNAGFTLIELLLVMIIIGAATGLAAPLLVNTLDSIKAQAEEQKLTETVEAVSLRAFMRQVSYIVEFRDNVVTVRNEQFRLEFEYIDFPPTTLKFNANGFTDSDTLRYIIRGKEKFLNVS
jgi:prepilin-type N-terminal cleavage/methylation domain-containing protein